MPQGRQLTMGTGRRNVAVKTPLERYAEPAIAKGIVNCIAVQRLLQDAAPAIKQLPAEPA